MYHIPQFSVSKSVFSSAIKQYNSLDHRHQYYSHDSVIVKFNNDRMNDIFNRITCILMSIANEIFISRTLAICCNAVLLGNWILYQYLKIPPFILTWRASKPVLRVSILTARHISPRFPQLHPCFQQIGLNEFVLWNIECIFFNFRSYIGIKIARVAGVLFSLKTCTQAS